LLNSNDVCVREITVSEQQRFTSFSRKRIGKTVAEIQLGWMPAAFPEISVGVSRNLRLNFRNGLNGDACFSNEIIKPPRRYRVAAGVDHNCGFNKINRTDGSLHQQSRAQDIASGSSRRMAMIADVSMIILEVRDRHRAFCHDRQCGTAP
jgi:hypothetical protein